MTSQDIDQRARLDVENRREWFGDQRMGAFRVRVDGEKAGVILPGQVLELVLPAGRHVVRIRQWYYRSAPLPLELSAGSRVVLEADVNRRGSLLRRVARGMLRPSRNLALTSRSDPAQPLPGLVPVGQASLRRTGRATLVAVGLGSGAGCLLGAIADQAGHLVLAIALLVVAVGFPIPVMRSLRRRLRS